MAIDLHLHSTASDGTDAPAGVVAAAAAAGLTTVALTDHDTTAGWAEAAEAARRFGVTLVPGAEISCQSGGIGVHMLSYLHDPSDHRLRTELGATRDDRLHRARRMVERIGLDHDLTWEDVLEHVGADATVGRPHIADAMVSRGLVLSRDEAFATVLHTRSPYYRPHYAPDAERVVRLIRAAGGVPVMAHPRAGRRGRVVSEDVIADLAAAGLAGLEVDHRDHDAADRLRLRALAAGLGLLATGSSDYHGTGKVNVIGEHTTAPEVLEAILAQGTGAEVVRGVSVGAGEQQELAGMPARLYPCTPTRLGTWRRCPRLYRFSYLDRPAPPKGAPWAHNSVGAAVHSALADWWGMPLARRTPEAGAAVLRRRWLTDGFRDGAQASAARERAAGWVAAYLAGVDPAAEPVGVERTVSATTRTLVLSGRADRIDARGAALVVVDYKTGRHVPDPADARDSLALAAYAVAARRMLRRPAGRVELHHLPSGTVAAAEHDEAGLAARVAEAEAIGAECARADAAHARGETGDTAFPPVPSPSCSWCDFRRHCPAGRAAAPDVAPWAGLAT